MWRHVLTAALLACAGTAGTCGEVLVPVRPAEAEQDKAPAKAAPALTDEQRQVLDQAIRDLGSEDYATREAASARILAIGRAAVPLLEEKLKSEREDAERGSRLRKLLDDLRADGQGEPFGALAQALEGKVSFEFADTPAAEAMEFLSRMVGRAGQAVGRAGAQGAILAKLSGVRFSVDDALAQMPVSLKVNDMALKTAIEWIARLLDARVIKSGNTLRLAVKK